MTPHLRIHWFQRGALVIGLLLIALWSANFLESRGFQASESRKLEAALREAASGLAGVALSDVAFAGTRGAGLPKRATAPRGVLGRLEIPRLRITAIVAEGSDMKTLRHAVGHVTWTALPGRPGNCALAGHRDSFLRGLGGLRVNDVIRIVAPERTLAYQVEWTQVVDPHRVDVLDSTATRSLTLVTCYPFEFVGHAPKRFIVRARQVGAGEGTTASLGTNERAASSIAATRPRGLSTSLPLVRP